MPNNEAHSDMKWHHLDTNLYARSKHQTLDVKASFVPLRTHSRTDRINLGSSLARKRLGGRQAVSLGSSGEPPAATAVPQRHVWGHRGRARRATRVLGGLPSARGQPCGPAAASGAPHPWSQTKPWGVSEAAPPGQRVAWGHTGNGHRAFPSPRAQ